MTTVTVLGVCEVPAVPSEVAGVRRWLCGLLAGDHGSVVDDVVLLACELVTNSILHSDSAGPGQDGAPGVVRLVVVGAGDVVRVEVIDAGSARSTPRVVADGGDGLSGRGLRMVAAMSDRWGTCAGGEGRTTWFEIAGVSGMDGVGSDLEGGEEN